MFFRSTNNREAAERKYAQYRLTVYQHVVREGDYPRKTRLDFFAVTALKTYKDVWLLHERRVDWDWPGEIERWRRSCPSRLEMSVWHENHLCGLLIARTSSNKKTLYIEGIEGAPYNHPLKGLVIPICIAASEAYAAMLDAKEVRIVEPDPAVISAYVGLGYTIEEPLFPSGKYYALKPMGEMT